MGHTRRVRGIGQVYFQHVKAIPHISPLLTYLLSPVLTLQVSGLMLGNYRLPKAFNR